MDIPQGYKQTAVGIIPQEWKVDRLGEICLTFKSGTTITSQSIKESGLYPVYGGNGLRGYTDSYTHNGDYILIGRQGALCGNINFIRGKAYISEHAIAVQPNESNSIEFLRYKLDFWNLNRFSESSAQPGLSVEKLVRYKLAVPPMEEQRKIAEILGVWDEAIEKQSRLIERLEVRKHALMQRLLTGRTRLSGFTSPWQKVKLGEIGTIYNGLIGKSKDDFESGNAKFVPYINVFSNEKIDINNLGCVKVDSGENQNKVKFGDIFFTISSETPDEVGMASVLLEDVGNTYLNSFCFGYRLNDFEVLNPVFASYILRGDKFRKSIITLAQGSTRFNISKSEVMKLRIELPSLPEQKAIAEVLTAADNEIATHRKKLAALRHQKRGLMQQLLTGKTRVKI